MIVFIQLQCLREHSHEGQHHREGLQHGQLLQTDVGGPGTQLVLGCQLSIN